MPCAASTNAQSFPPAPRFSHSAITCWAQISANVSSSIAPSARIGAVRPFARASSAVRREISCVNADSAAYMGTIVIGSLAGSLFNTSASKGSRNSYAACTRQLSPGASRWSVSATSST